MSVILSKIKDQTGEAIFPATLHGKFIRTEAKAERRRHTGRGDFDSDRARDIAELPLSGDEPLRRRTE